MTPRRALGLVLLPVADRLDRWAHAWLPTGEWLPLCKACMALDAWRMGW